jgi:hypothetical protein
MDGRQSEDETHLLMVSESATTHSCRFGRVMATVSIVSPEPCARFDMMMPARCERHTRERG